MVVMPAQRASGSATRKAKGKTKSLRGLMEGIEANVELKARVEIKIP